MVIIWVNSTVTCTVYFRFSFLNGMVWTKIREYGRIYGYYHLAKTEMSNYSTVEYMNKREQW